MKRINPVPVVFLLLFLVGLYYSEMTPTFVLNEVITRFSRDGILVLALVLPVAAGMGINFAIVVGAMCAQVGLLTIIILQVNGESGWLLGTVIAIVLSVIVGYLIGRTLNRVKGREMITTLIIGLLATGIYQFIFMVGYGTFIPAHNEEILLSTGKGIRNMVDLAPYRNMLDKMWVVEVGDIRFPMFMIMLVLLACAVVAYLLNTRLGQRIKAVGQDRSKAELLGIDVNRTRIIAMVLSIVIACIGQMLFLQNIGMLNVYTAHQNSDIFSAAALLAGGATIKEARVRHVILGIFLFHSLFIVSPQAGQNMFDNAALGEYFRSFVAYGTIALALILSVRRRDRSSNPLSVAESGG
ncbi:MAG: ABC transporter permease [Dehalococcoidia bacterium]|nr:ABC transporter permease [Dehalococcoidia bacterium]